MAYIPPHKRVSQTHEGPPPMSKPLNLISSICGTNASTSSNGMIVRIADHYISTWPAVPSTDDEQLPSSVCLVPVCPQSLGQKTGQKELILVNNHLKQERNVEDSSFTSSANAGVTSVEAPAASVAQRFSSVGSLHTAAQACKATKLIH